jgi:hypothetical protein
MTPDDIPECACSAHPSGDDKKKYMVVAEETNTMIVWCCRRCTEITHTAVIQVRTLRRGREMAQHAIAEQRRAMDPRLLRLLMERKRGRIRYRDADKETTRR